MPGPSGMSRQGIPEGEADDWLLGYLANTKVGADPKINAATQRVVEANRKRRAKAPLGKGAGPGQGGALFGRGVMRRSSWAAGPSGKPLEVSVATAAARVAAKDAAAGAPAEKGAEAQPTLDASALRQKHQQAQSSQPPSAAPGPPQPVPDVANSSTSRMAMLQAGSVYHKTSLQEAAAAEQAKGEDNFLQWAAMSSGSGGRERRMSSSIGGGARVSTSVGPRPGSGAPNQRRMSTSRLSMSGRRQSMDYSELDAVKQRLQHATTLWAVADDEDSDASSSDGEEEKRQAATSRGPETAAAAGSDTVSSAGQATGKSGLFTRSGTATREGQSAEGAAPGSSTTERKGFLKAFLGRGKG